MFFARPAATTSFGPHAASVPIWLKTCLCGAAKHTHAHTHARTHTPTPAHMHTCTHTHTHTRAHGSTPVSTQCQHPPPTHTHTHMHTHVGCTFLPWLIKMQCACTHMGATRVANGITAHEGSLLTGAIDSATCWHHVMPLSAFGQHGPARPPRGLQTPFWWQMCPHGGPTGHAGPNDGSTTCG